MDIPFLCILVVFKLSVYIKEGKGCDSDLRGGCCYGYEWKDGACAVCPAGFVGVNCKLPCPTGFYGVGCKTPCICTDLERCYPTIGCAPINVEKSTQAENHSQSLGNETDNKMLEVSTDPPEQEEYLSSQTVTTIVAVNVTWLLGVFIIIIAVLFYKRYKRIKEIEERKNYMPPVPREVPMMKNVYRNMKENPYSDIDDSQILEIRSHQYHSIMDLTNEIENANVKGEDGYHIMTNPDILESSDSKNNYEERNVQNKRFSMDKEGEKIGNDEKEEDYLEPVDSFRDSKDNKVVECVTMDLQNVNSVVDVDKAKDMSANDCEEFITDTCLVDKEKK